VSAGSIELRAGAIRDEDYLYRTFDANLILAGVLAVKVSITNGGAESVDLKSLRFSLNRAGQSKRPIEPRRAFKSLVKYYKIKAYNPKGYKVALADFVSYGLDARVPLPPGESRWGLIFFEIAAEQPEKTGVVLSVKGLGAVELTLNVD